MLLIRALLVPLLLFGFALGLLALPGDAGDTAAPGVPLQLDADKRFIVGKALYLRGLPAGSPNMNLPDLMPVADEVAIRLYDYSGPEVREEVPTVGGLRLANELVPQVVEIRRYVPGVPDTLLPLLRLIWDADRDGLADYVAVPEVRGGKPGFLVYAFPQQGKPRMATLWYFPEREIPKLVQL